jgi:hypothetical protein
VFGYQGSPNSYMQGVVYQPRGAYAVMNGGGSSANVGEGKLQIFTGAIKFQGSSTLAMTLATPVVRRIIALVE